jgi:hypothetical protein
VWYRVCLIFYAPLGDSAPPAFGHVYNAADGPTEFGQ